jgi:hypothetical protein
MTAKTIKLNDLSDANQSKEETGAAVGIPGKKKVKVVRLVFMLLVLAVLGGATAYTYLGSILKSDSAPLNFKTAENTKKASPSLQQMSSPDVQSQESQPAGTQNTPSHAQGQIYTPAKDILSGTADLRPLKEKKERLKEELEIKEIEKKLEQTAVEIQIIPAQSAAAKAEIASKMASSKVRVVETKQEMPPPALISVLNNIATLRLATGEQYKAKAGDTIGEFKVVSVARSSVIFSDKQDRQISVGIKYPDKYTVAPSTFTKSGSGNIPVSAPSGMQYPAQPNFQTPQYIPSKPTGISK